MPFEDRALEFYYEPSECRYTPGNRFDGSEECPYTPLSHGSAWFLEFYNEPSGVSLQPRTSFPRDYTGVSLYSPYHGSTRDYLYPNEQIQGSTGTRTHITTRFLQPLLPDEPMTEGKRFSRILTPLTSSSPTPRALRYTAQTLRVQPTTDNPDPTHSTSPSSSSPSCRRRNKMSGQIKEREFDYEAHELEEQ